MNPERSYVRSKISLLLRFKRYVDKQDLKGIKICTKPKEPLQIRDLYDLRPDIAKHFLQVDSWLYVIVTFIFGKMDIAVLKVQGLSFPMTSGQKIAGIKKKLGGYAI